LEAVRAGNVEAPSTYAREVPAELEAIAMRALAKLPADRFQTARDLSGALTQILFHKREVVDSHLLEHVIAELVSREHTSPGVLQPTEGPAESAPSPPVGLFESTPARQAPATAELPWSDEATGPGRPRLARRLGEHAGREVRHVAVVVVRIQGLGGSRPSSNRLPLPTSASSFERPWTTSHSSRGHAGRGIRRWATRTQRFSSVAPGAR